MKYTGRIIITMPLLLTGLFWFFLSKQLDGHTIKPIYFLLFSILALPFFWFAGRLYDKSIYLTDELRNKSIELEVDISQHKKVEKKLMESEHRYRLLTEYSPVAVMVHWEGKIVYVNPSCAKILGADKVEDLIGLHLSEFIHSDYQTFVEQRIENLIKGKELEYLEVKIVSLDGKEKDVEVVSSLIQYNGNSSIMVVAKDITEQKKTKDFLYHFAYHDALTGLPNRKLFEEKLKETLIKAKEDNQEMAVMFLDIDGFKAVNDTFGHNTGDILLQQVTERLQSCVRKHDTLSRRAGDEFTILLPETSSSAAIKIAERVIKSFNPPFLIEGKSIRVTTSIGISIYQDAFNWEQLIKNADLAMYRAKQKGKNAYQIYHDK